MPSCKSVSKPSGRLPMCHQPVFMFMKIRFFVDLKVVKVRILKLIFFK